MDAIVMQRRSHVMNQNTAVYRVPTKEVELRRLFTIVRRQAHLHVCLARLEDRTVIPSRRRLKDLPALSRLGKINKSLLDLQTLLLELLIPAPDGLSKTLDDVEIHLKSPRYPETRSVLVLFPERSAHAADKLVLHVTMTRLCGKEVKARKDLEQDRPVQFHLSVLFLPPAPSFSLYQPRLPL